MGDTKTADVRQPLEWPMMLLLALGAFLRLRQFVFNRSLWLDEAYLATSFIDRGVWALITEPLANGQAAPLGFLLAVKASFAVFGGTDWALRLVPLLSGLATLWVAWRVSALAWRHSIAQLLFVGLVALSPVLIYYTSEFKQYGGDVLFTLLAVWACLKFRTADLPAGLMRLAWIGVLGVWFSHPSVFLLAAVGLILGMECVADRQWRAVRGLVIVGGLWLLSFGLHYLLGVKAMAANPALTRFWTSAYAPMPPFATGDLGWFWENGLGLVYLAFRHVGIAHHLVLPAWTDAGTVWLMVAVLLGWLVSWRLNRRLSAMLILPIVITLLASGLALYPFRSRLILFLIPLIWMAAASGVEVIHSVGLRWARTRGGFAGHVPIWFSVLLSTVLVISVAKPTWKHVLKPYNDADIKGAMGYIKDRRDPGDDLMINSWSQKAFAFYSRAFHLDDMPLYIYRKTPNVAHDAYHTVKRLCQAGEAGRTWFLLSHRFHQRQEMLVVLQTLAPIDEQWEGEGAGVYRVNFADTPYCDRYKAPVQK